MSRFGTQPQVAPLQATLPYVIAVLCVVLHGIPLGLIALPNMALALFLIPLFAINLTSEMDRAPIYFVAIGLLADILMEAPLGYWAFLAGLFYILSSGQKQVLQNATFRSQWFSFIIVLLIVYLAGFVISLLRSDLDIQFGAHLFSALITGLVYPIMAWPLSLIMAPAQEGL